MLTKSNIAFFSGNVKMGVDRETNPSTAVYAEIFEAIFTPVSHGI